LPRPRTGARSHGVAMPEDRPKTRSTQTQNHLSRKEIVMKKLNTSVQVAAQSELAFYFSASPTGEFQTPEAHTTSPAARAAADRIDGWLGSIKTFHKGALALAYTPRVWPEGVEEYFGELAGIAVRLDCAAHPAVGVPVGELEAAAAERLAGMIASSELRGYKKRARGYLKEAFAAYVAAREGAPCVVPPPEGDPEEAPDTVRDPVPLGEEVAS